MDDCYDDVRAGLILCVGVGALAATTLITQATHGDGWFALDVVAAAVSVLLLPLLVRFPIAGGLLLGCLAALSPAATPAATAFAFTVAQRRRLSDAVAVGLAGLAGHAVQGQWRPIEGIAYGWWLTLAALAYATLLGWGRLLQARRALLDSLRDRALRAEQDAARRVAEARVGERNQIAREMHDVLAHRLSLVATYAGALEYRPDSSPAQLAEAAGVVRAGVHEAMIELREIVSVLRDGELEDRRPQPLLADIPRLVEESRVAGQCVDLDDRGGAGVTGVSTTVARTAFRVVQEGLTNARKHAAGQPVRVLIDGSNEDTLTVELRNALGPQGFSPLPGGGAGLVGLSERVRLAGGTLDHDSAGGEFRLCARLPT